MLSITKIKFFFLLFLILFLITGCVRKRSSYDYSRNYNSNNNGVSLTSTYSPSSSSKIRNSKAMHRATMKPYNVFGKWYHPTVAKVGDELEGIASWYGPNFHSKKTSNGEVYDMYGMTAAHKTLPMNTVVKVYNLDNNKSVIVRVNDRGPFVRGRIIDLSNKAAHDIDMVGRGTANVRVEVLGFNGKVANTKEERDEEVSLENYYLQIGAFSKLEGANSIKRKFELILENRYDIIIKDSNNYKDQLHRVWISGFKSEAEARDFKEQNNLNKATIIAK